MKLLLPIVAVLSTALGSDDISKIDLSKIGYSVGPVEELKLSKWESGRLRLLAKHRAPVRSRKAMSLELPDRFPRYFIVEEFYSSPGAAQGRINYLRSFRSDPTARAEPDFVRVGFKHGSRVFVVTATAVAYGGAPLYELTAEVEKTLQR